MTRDDPRMNGLAESQSGNLYPAWVKPGEFKWEFGKYIEVNFDDMMRNVYLVINQVLGSKREIIRDT